MHYTDLGGLFHTTRKQLALNARFAEAGICAVLGMGSAPGVPNVQARYAADRLDTLESIRIYDGIKPPPADDVRFTYAVPTIVDELTLAHPAPTFWLRPKPARRTGPRRSSPKCGGRRTAKP